MLALRGVYEKGKIELLDPAPGPDRSLVAIIFLDMEPEEIAEAAEAMFLARSPALKRLVEMGLTDIQRHQTRPVQELLDELSD